MDGWNLFHSNKLNTTPKVTSTKKIVKTEKLYILQGPIRLGLQSKFIEGLEELQKSGIVDGTKDPTDWSQ